MYLTESEPVTGASQKGRNRFAPDRKHEILAMMKQTCISDPLPGREISGFPEKI